MKPQQAFGKILRASRHQRGLSQEQLGFESGYHRTYISQLERGEKSPSITTVFHLARALNIAPSEMVRLVENQVGKIPRRYPGERS